MSVARFIADQRTFYRVPVAVCCAILGLSTGWFYKWIKSPVTGQPRRRREPTDAGHHSGGVTRIGLHITLLPKTGLVVLEIDLGAGHQGSCRGQPRQRPLEPAVLDIHQQPVNQMLGGCHWSARGRR